MRKVKPRTVRIEDTLWEQALAACESNGTTVITVVRTYLRYYIAESVRYQERTGQKLPTKAIPNPRKRASDGGVKPLTEKEIRTTYRGDPAKCYHVHLRKATYGTICLGCGTLMAPAKSVARFLEILKDPDLVVFEAPPGVRSVTSATLPTQDSGSPEPEKPEQPSS